MKKKNHPRYNKQTKDHDMKERNLSLSLSLSFMRRTTQKQKEICFEI
jgi:hypothetical protein